MDKKIAGLLGGVAALTTLTTAGASQAAPLPSDNGAQPISSYADLLKPVPNALEALKADDAARSQKGVELAQIQIEVGHHHHHHHHHHRHWRRRHRHHHHHHHHHSMYFAIPRGTG